VSAFELTEEERQAVRVNVDRFEVLLPAVRAAHCSLVPILERYEAWSPVDQEEAELVRAASGVGRIYDLCFELEELFRVLSGTEALVDRAA
jgi:hypothetical protein